MIPLSKTLDPADFDHLPEELAIVDTHFAKARPQHAMRRWEYAMALRAQQTWAALPSSAGERRRVADVGGAGSPFHYMVGSDVCYVIDPEEGMSLEQFLHRDRNWLFPQVFCLSVLEHVEDLDRFLYHLSCLVAPGGLLFLTMDACKRHGQYFTKGSDTFHFHWMRTRIFGAAEWPSSAVASPLLDRDFDYLQSGAPNAVDPVYHGAHVYDYTFASLALVKRA